MPIPCPAINLQDKNARKATTQAVKKWLNEATVSPFKRDLLGAVLNYIDGRFIKFSFKRTDKSRLEYCTYILRGADCCDFDFRRIVVTNVLNQIVDNHSELKQTLLAIVSKHKAQRSVQQMEMARPNSHAHPSSDSSLSSIPNSSRQILGASVNARPTESYPAIYAPAAIETPHAPAPAPRQVQQSQPLRAAPVRRVIPANSHKVTLSPYAKYIQKVLVKYIVQLSREERAQMRRDSHHPKLKALQSVANHLESHDVILLKEIFSHPELKDTLIYHAAKSQALRYLYNAIEALFVIMTFNDISNGKIKSGIVTVLTAILIEKIDGNIQLLYNLHEKLLEYLQNMLLHFVVPYLAIPSSIGNSITNICTNTYDFTTSNLLFFSRPFGMQHYFGLQENPMKSVTAILQDQEVVDANEERIDACVIS